MSNLRVLPYSPKARSERLIAAGRLALVAFIALSVWLEPFGSDRSRVEVHILLSAYLGYAVLMLWLVWMSRIRFQWLGIISHALDLLAFGVYLVFTQGSISLFFVYFVYALFCAMLRRHRSGITWIVLTILFLFLGLDFSLELFGNNAVFEPARFLIHCAYFIIVAILLLYLNTYTLHLQEDLQCLAAWSHVIPDPQQMQTLLRTTLRHAGAVLRAPRMLMIWNEPEQPHLQIAGLSGTDFQLQKVPPSLFRPLAAKTLVADAFLCMDARTDTPEAIIDTAVGLRRWSGSPLHQDLVETFNINQVLAIFLNGEQNFHGWLLFLDKQGMTSDDLNLASIAAKHVITDMEQFYLQRQLQKTAIAEERLRMSRDLHDSVLQFLPGIGLHLETVNQLLTKNAADAQQQLQEIQTLIVNEQRALRNLVQQLKTVEPAAGKVNLDCHTCLTFVAKTLENQWGMKVTLSGEPLIVRLPTSVAQEIHYLVHEAMINSARHSGGRHVQAAITREREDLQISVRDDGHGFPFHGCYDLAELNAKNIGPKSLKERVAALGGWLNIDSNNHGSSLLITVPISEQ